MTSTLNLKKKMGIQLSKDVLDALSVCSVIASKNGYKIFLIGGVVRDLILGKKIFDIDITVAGDATDFCHLLADKKLCKILQVQNDLKTVKALFNCGVEIDFASTRQEVYPKKGHLPMVVEIGCTLKEDVLRRDFTINSLALSLNIDSFGDVIDYVGGIEDLKKKKLKILHDASFIDDPTRIIRGLKFAARFGLKRDENTKKVQDEYIKNLVHDDISWTRLKNELKQTFNLNNAKAYDMFLNAGMQVLVHGDKPELTGLEIKTLVDKFEPENVWLIYLGTVLKDEKIIDSFCLTRAERKIFSEIMTLAESNLSVLNSNYDIYKYFEKRSTEAIIVYYLLSQRKEALIYLEKLSGTKILLKGDELKELGVNEGREMGEILNKILKKKLSGTLVKKEDELNYAKEILNTNIKTVEK